MRIAYLILAHDNEQHLSKLIGTLLTENSEVFIHIDKKSDIGKFKPLRGPRVALLEDRASVFWGDYSQVDAILKLMKTALGVARPADRLVLISGSDYPIRSTAYIEQYFKDRPTKEFIDIVEIPCIEAARPISRVTDFWPSHGSILSYAEKKIRWALVKLKLKKVEREYSAVFGDQRPFGGSTWWALTKRACEYIVARADEKSSFIAFFRNAVCADELMFPTLIGNSDFRKHAATNLTYTDWSKQGWRPENMAEEHIVAFEKVGVVWKTGAYGQGENLFARKFGQDAGLLARVDAMRNAKGMTAA